MKIERDLQGSSEKGALANIAIKGTWLFIFHKQVQSITRRHHSSVTKFHVKCYSIMYLTCAWAITLNDYTRAIRSHHHGTQSIATQHHIMYNMYSLLITLSHDNKTNCSSKAWDAIAQSRLHAPPSSWGSSKHNESFYPHICEPWCPQAIISNIECQPLQPKCEIDSNEITLATHPKEGEGERKGPLSPPNTKIE